MDDLGGKPTIFGNIHVMHIAAPLGPSSFRACRIQELEEQNALLQRSFGRSSKTEGQTSAAGCFLMGGPYMFHNFMTH